MPWCVQGPHWEPGEPRVPASVTEKLQACSRCGEPLGEVRVVLIRHRGEHRIADAFCSVDHMTGWAKAGGRYA